MAQAEILSSHPSYRPDIDGLRAIAVLSVVVFHAFPAWMRGGFTGVDVFFVISGFLISTIIFENLEKGTFSFAEFYARRVRRIFPALILILSATLLTGWLVLLDEEFRQLGKHVAAGAGFFSNVVLQNEVGYFDSSADSKPLLHLWSLGIEEQFYLLWPLLLWLACRANVSLLMVTLGIVVASYCLNIFGVKGDKSAIFYLSHTRFWELLCGSLLAWASLYGKVAWAGVRSKIDGFPSRSIGRALTKVNGSSLANVSSLLGAVLLLYGFWKIHKYLSFPGKWALLPVLGAVLIIAAGPRAWFNRKILSSRILVWFGLISFPLYLWHWPMLAFARIVSIDPPSAYVRITLVLCSVVLAWLTYRFIEMPVRKAGAVRTKAKVLVCLVTLIGLTGGIVYGVERFETRGISKLADSLYSHSARLAERRYMDEYRNYTGGDPSSSNKPVVLIIGDSYNTAWTAALNSHIDLIRYDVASVNYLGCMITKVGTGFRARASERKYEMYCNPFESLINNDSVVRRLAAVMFVSHRPFENLNNPFRFEIIRWLKMRNPGSEIFVFGNYFQLDADRYLSCERLMLITKARANVCLQYADYPVSGEIDVGSRFYPANLDFKYIDLIGLHCAYDKSGCATESKGVPFTSDGIHLNATFIDHILSDIRRKNPDRLSSLGIRKYFDGQH